MRTKQIAKYVNELRELLPNYSVFKNGDVFLTGSGHPKERKVNKAILGVLEGAYSDVEIMKQNFRLIGGKGYYIVEATPSLSRKGKEIMKNIDNYVPNSEKNSKVPSNILTKIVHSYFNRDLKKDGIEIKKGGEMPFSTVTKIVYSYFIRGLKKDGIELRKGGEMEKSMNLSEDEIKSILSKFLVIANPDTVLGILYQKTGSSMGMDETTIKLTPLTNDGELSQALKFIYSGFIGTRNEISSSDE